MGHCYLGWEIPDQMMDGLLLYVNDGILPGSFMQAVLSNDFVGAVKRADHANMYNLPAYADFLYNRAPEACWGSPEKMQAWAALHAERRLKRRKAASDPTPNPKER